MSDVSGRWWVTPTRVASRARGVVASHDTAVMRADRVQGPLRAVPAVQAGDDALANGLVVLVSAVCIAVLLSTGRLMRSRGERNHAV